MIVAGYLLYKLSLDSSSNSPLAIWCISYRYISATLDHRWQPSAKFIAGHGNVGGECLTSSV